MFFTIVKNVAPDVLGTTVSPVSSINRISLLSATDRIRWVREFDEKGAVDAMV